MSNVEVGGVRYRFSECLAEKLSNRWLSEKEYVYDGKTLIKSEPLVTCMMLATSS